MLKMLNSQKFLWGLIVFGISVAMLWLGKIDSSQWVDMTKYVTTFVIAANVAMGGIHGFAKNKVSSSEKQK